MVGWHHLLDGHEFDQAPGVGYGQGSLAYCSPWGHKRVGYDLATKPPPPGMEMIITAEYSQRYAAFLG